MFGTLSTKGIGWVQEDLQAEGRAEMGFHLVAERDDVVIAALMTWHLPQAEEVQLLQIATLPSCRRTGAASALLQVLTTDARCAAANADCFAAHDSGCHFVGLASFLHGLGFFFCQPMAQPRPFVAQVQRAPNPARGGRQQCRGACILCRSWICCRWQAAGILRPWLRCSADVIATA